MESNPIEKKWFVYLGKQHEGPFSLAELRIKRDQGQISDETYAWCDGMSDWAQISGLDSLKEELKSLEPKIPKELPLSETARSEFDPSSPVQESPTLLLSPHETETDQAQSQPVSLIPAEEGAPVQTQQGSPKGKRGRLLKTTLNWLMMTVLMVSMAIAGWKITEITRKEGVFYWSRVVTEKFPQSGQWLPVLPKFKGVKPESQTDLESAVVGSVDRVGPKVALAAVLLDPAKPEFVVATNLGDGTKLEVVIEGIPETLLNTTQFLARRVVTITRRVGQTLPFTYEDGRPVPKGRYRVYLLVADVGNQDSTWARIAGVAEPIPALITGGRKALIKREWFLGGESDSGYEQRLKEFHEKVRQKAQAELDELKQLAMTLESQSTESTTLATRIRAAKKKDRTKLIKEWDEQGKKWESWMMQLSATVSQWTPEVLAKDYYYPGAFTAVRELVTAVQSLRAVEDRWVKMTMGAGAIQDRESLEIQLGEIESSSQSALMNTKTKLDWIEKSSLSTEGLPKKEGT